MKKSQHMLYALLTVIITVHAYVFYSLYVVNGPTLMATTGASSVLGAIKIQGGISVFGFMLPIWAIIIMEIILAYTLEILFGSRIAFKLASNYTKNKKDPLLFEFAIICGTIIFMCPAMSFFNAILYYPYMTGFNIFTLLADWIKLICFNFPFAFFSQTFFIQPFVRKVFQIIYKTKDSH